ncbi:MAG: glycerol-3-phosphate acyltransferase [Chloroflexota bacterium]|nr:MAG: glycerol-3-phosphate acyltransferase [Chloroflexota bacterium]
MNLWIALVAAVLGYLSGSVSYARLVARLADPDRKIGKIKVSVPGRADTYVESDSVSATTVRLQYGGRYGGLVSLLDMLKAAIPMLAFKLWQPDQPYYLVASVMAVVGHNWPIFYRFKGGRGLSCIIGSFFVLNWLGTIVTNVVGFLIGYRSRNMLVVTGAGIVLMIPWIMLFARDWVLVVYVVLMNCIYWFSMIPELREYARLRREGTLEEFQEADALEVVQEDGTVRYDSNTLHNLRKRINSKLGRENAEA